MCLKINNIHSSTDTWHEGRLTECTVGREGVEWECTGHEVPDGADGSVKVSNPQENLRSKLMVEITLHYVYYNSMVNVSMVIVNRSIILRQLFDVFFVNFTHFVRQSKCCCFIFPSPFFSRAYPSVSAMFVYVLPVIIYAIHFRYLK